MTFRSLIVSYVLLTACSSPAFDVAGPGADTSPDETTAREDGADVGTDAPSEIDTIDAGEGGGADADAPSGIDLPCTNMAECTPYGLVCISQPAPGCAEADCLRYYKCEPHPAADKCTDDTNCIDIHCVTVADCPTGSNFCVGDMAITTASGVTPLKAYGFWNTHCSSGAPAKEPEAVFFGERVYTCSTSGDCVMGDGAIGTCCPTSVGISYCASECAYK